MKKQVKKRQTKRERHRKEKKRVIGSKREAPGRTRMLLTQEYWKETRAPYALSRYV